MNQKLFIPTLHMIVVTPLLAYIGWALYKKIQLSQDFGMLLILFALLIFFYHAYKFYKYY